MKLNVKSFVISVTVIFSLPMIILFIWSSLNGFGLIPVKIFESVHPSGGFSIIENLSGTFLDRLPGILINSVYVIIDSIIFGFAFSKLYNFFNEKFPESDK